MINTEITPIVHGNFVVFTQHPCHIIISPAGVARLSDWNITRSSHSLSNDNMCVTVNYGAAKHHEPMGYS